MTDTTPPTAPDSLQEIAEQIPELALLDKHNRAAETIPPYPTQAEIIKRAADQDNRRRLTPFVKWAFKTLLALAPLTVQGEVPESKRARG